MMVKTIGIIGYGHYGKLVHELIRRFALWVRVFVYELDMQDDQTFVTLEKIAACNVVVLAVPMHSFEKALREVLATESICRETIIVNVCTEQEVSGATLRALASQHKFLSVHTLWGPEGYHNVGGDVRRLPPAVITDTNLDDRDVQQVLAFVAEKGFGTAQMTAETHDEKIVAEKMYVAHLFSQLLNLMGMLHEDEYSSIAPLSFQDLLRSAMSVKGDVTLFMDLWTRLKKCQKTWDTFVRAVHLLESMKEQHQNGK